MPGSYYVYIMTNKSGTLYTGVINDFETGKEIVGAIEREKQIKVCYERRNLSS